MLEACLSNPQYNLVLIANIGIGVIHCDDAYCRGLLKDLQLNLKKNSQSVATIKEIKTDKLTSHTAKATISALRDELTPPCQTESTVVVVKSCSSSRW